LESSGCTVPRREEKEKIFDAPPIPPPPEEEPVLRLRMERERFLSAVS
jgi:hypothetical protein